MPTIVKKWKCVHCGTSYDDKPAAVFCEEECSQQAEIESLRKEREKHFPTSHETDDRYVKHCVDCGKRLEEWSCDFDGHRNERGSKLFEERHVVVMGGRRCLDCRPAFEKKVMALQGSKNKTVQKILAFMAMNKL